MVHVQLSDEDKVFIKRLLQDIEEALRVLVDKASLDKPGVDDLFALRYSIIEIVESLAVVSTHIAQSLGYSLEGYVEAMRFLSRQGIVDLDVGERLVRLARLRNILIHRYWVVDDYRVIREARENGIECIRRALNGLYRLIEG